MLTPETLLDMVAAILSNDDGAGDRLDRLYALLTDEDVMNGDAYNAASFLDEMRRGYLDAAAWSGVNVDADDPLRCARCFRAIDRSDTRHFVGAWKCLGCGWATDGVDFAHEGQVDALALEIPWSDTARITALGVCREFFLDDPEDCETAANCLADGWATVGHLLWLTRNGHGTGFWDAELGQVGLDLTELAKGLGETGAWLTEHGELELED